jgi:hypothetical protein
MNINNYSEGLICHNEQQIYTNGLYNQLLRQEPLIEPYLTKTFGIPDIDFTESTTTYNQTQEQEDNDFNLDDNELFEELEHLIDLDMIGDSNSSANTINNNNNNNNSNAIAASQKSVTTTETEYTNLFRGFSTLIDIENIALDRLKSVDANNNSNMGLGMNSETTVPDLADLILQEQLLHNSSGNASVQLHSGLPSSSTVAGPTYTTPQNSTAFAAQPSNPPKQELSQMSNVELNKIIKLPTMIKYATNESSMTTRSSTSRMANGIGPAPIAVDKAIHSAKTSERISLKRLSSTSNSTVTSTNTSVSSPGVPPPNKRGRKPNSINGSSSTTSSNLANKLKLNQKQELLINQGVKEDKLARFGNKYVEKYTNEYVKRRQSNNVAVQKCRQKLNEKQREREDRMKALDDENKLLLNKVDALNKELNVLKNIIIQMSPTKQLPACLEGLIKNLEST